MQDKGILYLSAYFIQINFFISQRMFHNLCFEWYKENMLVRLRVNLWLREKYGHTGASLLKKILFSTWFDVLSFHNVYQTYILRWDAHFDSCASLD